MPQLLREGALLPLAGCSRQALLSTHKPDIIIIIIIILSNLNPDIHKILKNLYKTSLNVVFDVGRNSIFLTFEHLFLRKVLLSYKILLIRLFIVIPRYNVDFCASQKSMLYQNLCYIDVYLKYKEKN